MASLRESGIWVTPNCCEHVNKWKYYRKFVLPIAISSIIYQRVAVDENDFLTGYFGGVSYKLLKPSSHNAYVYETNKMIDSALAALDKDYLRELYLTFESVYEPGRKEWYKFHYDYLGNGEIPLAAMFWTPEQIIIDFLMSIKNLSRGYMEGGVKFNIHFTCHDHVLPVNYVPAHFVNTM